MSGTGGVLFSPAPTGGFETRKVEWEVEDPSEFRPDLDSLTDQTQFRAFNQVKE